MNLTQREKSTVMMIVILALIVLGAIFKGVAVFTGAFLFAYGAVPLLGALLYKATPAVWEEVHKEHKDNTEFSILKLLPDVTLFAKIPIWFDIVFMLAGAFLFSGLFYNTVQSWITK